MKAIEETLAKSSQISNSSCTDINEQNNQQQYITAFEQKWFGSSS